MGAQLCGIPVGADGMDIGATGARAGTRAAALPGGDLEFPEPHRRESAAGRAARAAGGGARGASVPVVENDAYGELRYSASRCPPQATGRGHGGTVLLRSFSKVSFPGLRVGWVVGPKPLIDRCARPRKRPTCIPTSFPRRCCWNSPNRAAWRRTARACARRRRAPGGHAGGLPPVPARGHALDAAGRRHERVGAAAGAAGCGRVAAAGAAREGVAYMPGRYFAVSRLEPGALRLSFAGLTPEQIRAAWRFWGEPSSELESAARNFEPRRASAMVFAGDSCQ
jgi:2-aminoadipate transaminase